MLTVSDALNAIVTTVSRGSVVSISLEDALGFVLVEPIVSEVDSPPFDKSLMDGYAVRTADLAGGIRELNLIEEVTAGRVPRCTVETGQATRIMTGAPVPAGADAVIPVEETEFRPTTVGSILGIVSIRGKSVPQSGQFILHRAAAVARGTQLMQPGRTLRAQEIAALAELGHAMVQVVRRPRVAILATGDELVPTSQTPGAGQIRNSNEPMLAAQVREFGADPMRLGIARDDRSELSSRIAQGLECDFLLLSGGVSAGKLDLVPSVLADLGVRQVFHKIQMKPGKPLWFGVLERPDGHHCHVFGLPGNPVSAMVCCQLFVAAALRRWSGIEPAVAKPISTRLAAQVSSSSNRPTYHPARISWSADGPTVTLVDWIGSSDLCATIEANCVALLPAGDHTWAVDQRLDVFPWG